MVSDFTPPIFLKKFISHTLTTYESDLCPFQECLQCFLLFYLSTSFI